MFRTFVKRADAEGPQHRLQMDGAANTALVVLLAQCLAVRKRDIQIVRGMTGRSKILEITGITAETLEKKIKGKP